MTLKTCKTLSAASTVIKMRERQPPGYSKHCQHMEL
jgi:hypothetical protein